MAWIWKSAQVAMALVLPAPFAQATNVTVNSIRYARGSEPVSSTFSNMAASAVFVGLGWIVGGPVGGSVGTALSSYCMAAEALA